MSEFRKAKWDNPEIEDWDDEYEDERDEDDDDDDDDEEWRDPDERQIIIGVGGGFFGCYPRRFCFPRQFSCNPRFFGCNPRFFGCNPRFFGCFPRRHCRPRPCYPI